MGPWGAEAPPSDYNGIGGFDEYAQPPPPWSQIRASEEYPSTDATLEGSDDGAPFTRTDEPPPPPDWPDAGGSDSWGAALRDYWNGPPVPVRSGGYGFGDGRYAGGYAGLKERDAELAASSSSDLDGLPNVKLRAHYQSQPLPRQPRNDRRIDARNESVAIKENAVTRSAGQVTRSAVVPESDSSAAKQDDVPRSSAVDNQKDPVVKNGISAGVALSTEKRIPGGGTQTDAVKVNASRPTTQGKPLPSGTEAGSGVVLSSPGAVPSDALLRPGAGAASLTMAQNRRSDEVFRFKAAEQKGASVGERQPRSSASSAYAQALDAAHEQTSGMGVLNSVLDILTRNKRAEIMKHQEVQREATRARRDQEVLERKRAKLEEATLVTRRLEMCLMAAARGQQSAQLNNTRLSFEADKTRRLIEARVKVDSARTRLARAQQQMEERERRVRAQEKEVSNGAAFVEAREKRLAQTTHAFGAKIGKLKQQIGRMRGHETQLETQRAILQRQVSAQDANIRDLRRQHTVCEEKLAAGLDEAPYRRHRGGPLRFRSIRRRVIGSRDWVVSAAAEARKHGLGQDSTGKHKGNKECRERSVRDRCATHMGCGSCTADVECGWCAGEQACIPGNTHAAADAGLCHVDSWHYLSCPQYDCSNYRDCKTCLADPNCSACSANNTFRCVNTHYTEMDRRFRRDRCPDEALVRGEPSAFRFLTLDVFGEDAYQTKDRGRLILEAVERARPHFAAFTGVRPWFVAQLLARPWASSYHLSEFGNGQTPSGLLIISTFPLRRTSYYEETQPGQFRAEDRAKVLAVHPDIPGHRNVAQQLVVAVTALPSESSPAQRASALDFVFSVLSLYQNVVLSGGFGFDAQAQPESEHIPPSFADLWETLHLRERGATWDPVTNAYAFRSDRDSLPARVDRILVGSTHWAPRSIEMIGRCDIDTGLCPSNHYGLLAEVSLFQSFC